MTALPHISSEAIATIVVPLVGIIAHYFKTSGKLQKIEVSTNGNLQKLLADLKDAYQHIESLKAQLNQQPKQ